MKQKRKNRFLAALLAAAMMFQLLPLMVFADEGAGGEGSPSYVTLKSTGDRYSSLEDAVRNAQNTDTIQLGEGNYTLYGISSDDTTKGKDLTFVGLGPEKTVWKIGYQYDAPYGEDGDYSFDGADTVTFQKMTIQSGTGNYHGFARADHTVVEDCVIAGLTAYWGYDSAEFKNTTFKPSAGKDAIWVYSSKEATFDNCAFTAGRGVKVYTEENKSVTVNFNNCTVENSPSHPAIYIDEYVLEGDGGTQRYTINITGSNNVNAATYKKTCSKLFGFREANAHPGHFTNVSIDGKLVWSEGKMLTHDYTDGEKEGKAKVTTTDWVLDGDHYTRHVTKTCDYCHYEYCSDEEKEYDETGYKLSFDLDGGTAEDVSAYEETIEAKTTLPLAAPTKAGYEFVCWMDAANHETVYYPGDKITVTADTKLVAVWQEDTGEDTTPAGGDAGGAAAAVAVVVGAAGAAVLGYHLGTALLAQHYGMPYLPKNRSELALMLWEDAGKPMPNTQALYADVSQEEQNLQCAARWARENDLIPGADKKADQVSGETQFSPDGWVSRAAALNAWRKAQELRKTA